MEFVLKKLVSRSLSVFIPCLRRTPNHPPHLFSFIDDNIAMLVGGLCMRWTLNNSIPYTCSYTMKITSEGERNHLLDLDEKKNLNVIDNQLKYFFKIPGIEKTTETDEQLQVLVDLAMKDIDKNKLKAKLKKKDNAVLINGYVQQEDLRKYYRARVELPLPPRDICGTINTEIKDGELVITIPKVFNKEGTSTKGN
ncbi:uncharacterized protein [Rutidosis leptorrhynchoides]|uniref:uncharacterized protein n=1 Tax=Rutidosis leptorrhynchoides TaxID=125765 RepID=UPI003A99D216